MGASTLCVLYRSTKRGMGANVRRYRWRPAHARSLVASHLFCIFRFWLACYCCCSCCWWSGGVYMLKISKPVQGTSLVLPCLPCFSYCSFFYFFLFSFIIFILFLLHLFFSLSKYLLGCWRSYVVKMPTARKSAHISTFRPGV